MNTNKRRSKRLDCAVVFFVTAKNFINFIIGHASTVTLHCRAYSVGLDFSFFHLGQEINGGELELILQVNLQQGIVVTDIVLYT